MQTPFPISRRTFLLNHGNQSDQVGMISRGMMDFMAHPVHMHGVQSQVVERSIDAAQQAGWATLNGGFVDGGWTDAVLVMASERVKVLVNAFLCDLYHGRGDGSDYSEFGLFLPATQIP